LKERTLCFDVHEDIGTRIERKSCDSKHQHRILNGILRVDLKKVPIFWKIYITDLKIIYPKTSKSKLNRK